MGYQALHFMQPVWLQHSAPELVVRKQSPANSAVFQKRMRIKLPSAWLAIADEDDGPMQESVPWLGRTKDCKKQILRRRRSIT